MSNDLLVLVFSGALAIFWLAMSKQIKNTSIEGLRPAILEALRKSPMYGYALMKYLRSTNPELLKMNEGKLYPVLARMVEEGTISRREETIYIPGGKTRFVYYLNEQTK